MTAADDTRTRIETLLAEHPVVLFMKGSRGAPSCGFSATAAGLLDELIEDYHTVDVLADGDIREGIKVFGNWPTIPQLYIRGELVGGSDLVQAMFDSGELHGLLGVAAPDRTPPEVVISDAAVARVREALAGAGEAALFLSVDRHFQPQFQLREPGPHDIVVSTNGLELRFDAASAQRARGARIDWIEGPQGEGLAIELPLAPRPVRDLSVTELNERLQAGTITVIDVRPEVERNLAPFAGAEVLDPSTHARLTGLPKDTPLAFICHFGRASRDAAEHFLSHGFTRVWNVTGGIDAWSQQVDPAVPRY